MIGGPNGALVQINVKHLESKPADLLLFVGKPKYMKKLIAIPKVKYFLFCQINLMYAM